MSGIGVRDSASVPVLETPRLRLRGWRDEDVDSYMLIVGDPEVMRLLGTGRRYRLKRQVASWLAGISNLEARWGIARLRAHWQKWGFGEWAIEERSTGALIGQVGLVRHPDFRADPSVEIGWMLARRAWGQGFATEGARVAVEYAFEVIGLDRLISIARPANVRSEHVMKRLGLSLAGRTHWKGGEVFYYAINRAAWLGSKRQASS